MSGTSQAKDGRRWHKYGTVRHAKGGPAARDEEIRRLAREEKKGPLAIAVRLGINASIVRAALGMRAFDADETGAP